MSNNIVRDHYFTMICFNGKDDRNGEEKHRYNERNKCAKNSYEKQKEKKMCVNTFQS